MSDQNSSPETVQQVVERLNRPGRVCERLDISRTTLDALIRDGELDVVRLGSHRRITESSIRHFLERHRRP